MGEWLVLLAQQGGGELSVLAWSVVSLLDTCGVPARNLTTPESLLDAVGKARLTSEFRSELALQLEPLLDRWEGISGSVD
jgi:hypothetical protein